MSATLNKDLDEARLELAKAQAQKKRELRKLESGNKGVLAALGVGAVQQQHLWLCSQWEWRVRDGGDGRTALFQPVGGELTSFRSFFWSPLTLVLYPNDFDHPLVYRTSS